MADIIPPEEAALVSVGLSDLVAMVPNVPGPIPDVVAFLLAMALRWHDKAFVQEQIDWLERSADGELLQ